MIRNFTADDLEEVLQIWKQSNRQVHRFLPPYFWEQRCHQVKAALLQEEVFVAQEQGTIVGFAGLHRDWVQGLFVLPRHQGRGVGRMLLNTLKECRSQLWLQVYDKNQFALAFYLREGFVIHHRSLDSDSNEVKLTLLWRR